jgi:hypothetical protein
MRTSGFAARTAAVTACGSKTSSTAGTTPARASSLALSAERVVGDVMPGAQKERHQPPADGAGGAREEYSHFKSLIIAAGFGTGSSISREKLCPSPGAIGQPQVAQSENWYKNKRPCS